MHDFMSITKALADTNRVRILMSLENRELCVCQIIELLGLAPSTVSKHLSILSQARLVECRKTGRWIFYRLPDEDVSTVACEAIRWVQETLQKDKLIKEDNNRLKAILKIDPEKLCRQQTQS
jgi:DNA-binding transcriptional ArsR family regulator